MNTEPRQELADGVAPLLRVVGASKSFGGTQALRRVSLNVYPGEIVALLGENGAGKSTLIKSLAGVHQLDEGEMHFDGVRFDPAHANPGMAFIHQDHGLIDWMTVTENICLYLGYPRKYGMIDTATAEKRAAEALREVAANIDPDVRVSQLNRAERSIVAISRALLTQARVLILDEPTASLPADDVGRLFCVLRNLRSRGVGLVYVSHRLDEVFEIADRVVVLRDGEVVGMQDVRSATPEALIELIVGGKTQSLSVRPRNDVGAPRLTLNNLQIQAGSPLNAQFLGGEIVGLVGLRGAGQEKIGRALFGLEPEVEGVIRVDGEEIKPKNPAEAIAKGICLVWGDRTNGSIFPMLRIRENLYINHAAVGISAFRLIRPSREARQASQLGNLLHLRPNKPELSIDALSGGNQQKVVVGRWLHLKGRVYIFEDPTAGVDVGARAEIYKLFEQVSAIGATLLVISSDFEEVANICHRAYVFNQSRVVAELSGNELTLPRLLAAASASIPEEQCN